MVLSQHGRRGQHARGPRPHRVGQWSVVLVASDVAQVVSGESSIVTCGKIFFVNCIVLYWSWWTTNAVWQPPVHRRGRYSMFSVGAPAGRHATPAGGSDGAPQGCWWQVPLQHGRRATGKSGSCCCLAATTWVVKTGAGDPSSGSCLAAPSPPFTKWPHLPGADAEPARRVEVANAHTIPHEGGSSVAGGKGRGRTEPQTNRRECAGWREYIYRGRYGRPGHRCKWAVSLRTVTKRTCCTVLEG